MPFDYQSFLTEQVPREGAIMTSSILSYVWKNIGLTEKYLGGGEYSERHAEHFQKNLRFAQMAFEAGLNAFRGGDFDLWKDLIGPQQPTTAEHFLAAELWNQDGPSRRSGRSGRLEKRLILAPLDIGFRVLRYRNSAAIPSIAYQNRMRQAAELSAYMTRHQGNRNIEEITVYLFDRPICLGEDLASMTTRARADLSKVIRQLNTEYADKGCEIVFLREEDVLHPADNDVFVHVHLIAHMSKKSWIRNRFYRDFHKLWNYPVSGRIVRDVDALSCYLTKSVVIPEGTPPMFLRWFLLARHGSHSMARFGGFRKWYRNVICRHRGRVIRHNNGFRILVRCRDDKVDTADSLVIEDLEAATDVLTEACEGVEVVDEAKIRTQPDTGCSTSPDNIICGITVPRSEPGESRLELKA
ncbi:MAG: hypothetical protein IKD58_09180 [Loktanella sp.]|nr:hypothetical protein [Loktanella sp.]